MGQVLYIQGLPGRDLESYWVAQSGSWNPAVARALSREPRLGVWRKCGCGSAARPGWRKRASLPGCGVPGTMGRLHCTQDPVPEAVRGDMQQLNQLGAQVGLAWTGAGGLRNGRTHSGGGDLDL
jgi:hypothetical protein